MCGIFAYLGARRTVNQLILPIFSLRHRGPDSSVVQQVARNVVFGFHRLAINGLGNANNEPLQLDDCWLVCNGEIYNCHELERRYHFQYGTHNDCEAILHLYKHFDGDMESVVRQLDGVFAFVLYDAARDRVVAANDPIGIRPLYYVHNGTDNDDEGEGKEAEWVFASEPRALAPLAAERVHFFPPGHTWRSDAPMEFTSYRCTPLWKTLPEYKPINTVTTDEARQNLFDQLANQLRGLVGDAVRKRCVLTDRPVGCLLSGGLDSSIVASALASYLPAHECLHCFTIAIESDEDAPDMHYARKVVHFLREKRKRQVEHHVVVVSEQDFLDAIPHVVRAIQSYDITTVRASVGNYLIAKYIRERTDRIVIFNGDVSEEQFGSYRYSARAPSPEAFREDNERLLDEVYQYDVLRSARCMERFSLEPRTPFADRDLLRFTMAIPPELKMFGHDGDPHHYEPGKGFGIEKYLLRRAFLGALPDEVLWRYKEAFSDGVSAKKRSWHQIIAEHVAPLVSDEELAAAANVYPHCTPHTKEALYYRRLYEEELGATCVALVKQFWMPRFVDCGGDPSARALDAYRVSTD